MASSSSSSSSKRRKGGWTYDVFLSFRGEDVRNNFVDHLFAALVRNGIHTFKDDKMLGGGQPISQELVKAIKESRFAVVVFSKNYATSSWCLEELSNIMECHKQMTGQKVLPVFYHVDPSDVRGQKRDFATAFETHEDKFKGGDMEKVNKWREALTAAANLSGQHILPLNGGEAAFISKIVQQILADKQPCGDSRENDLIGIQPRIDALNSLLKMEATEEVRFVGIWGMGGIGKTTIARALFKRIAHEFEGSSFVRNVRENSSSNKDICALQQKILKDILGASSGFEIHDPEDGGEEIQERCRSKKVLLVLDDMNDVKQLDFLAATRGWFGPGSRIIITTRDQHLLSCANANDKYSPALLRTDQALELFSRRAFRKSSPPDRYMDLTNRAISYTHGLPLALKVLGSSLCGREASVWGSALDTLAETPSGEELEVIEGIVLPWGESMESLRADVFRSMKNLRVLDCYNNFTSCEPAFPPHGLRWLCWSGYPFSSLPVAHMSKLVGLEKIMLQNLKFIDLRRCESLKRFPDVSGAPNIESLDLSDCCNLVEVDDSVGSLKKLLHLDMSCCYKLKCLPSMLQMESLETLILCGLPPGIQVLMVEDCFLMEKIEDLSKEYKCLNTIRISDCPNGRNLEKMLDQSSLILKWAAVDGCLIIDIPGSSIPSWFKEQHDGCKIALKLPLKWQT